MSLYDEAILIQKPSGYKAEKLYNVKPSPQVSEQSSVEFDGVDDELITDGDSVAQPTTYSFWAKASETGGNTGVFGHGGNSKGGFHFNYGATQPLLYLGSSYYRYWADISEQDDGEWHHWVVYSDTNDITNSKLYVDGVLQTASSTNSSGSTSAYTEGLTIGSDQQSGGNYFEGSISDFAVFSRELSAADVKEIYNYGSPNDLLETSFVNDLDLYYQMGDGTLDDYPLIADQTDTTLGSELVTNGDFATDSDWTKGTGWTIGSGVASCNGTQTGTSSLYQSFGTANKYYLITFDVLGYSAGNVNMYFGTATAYAGAITANGTYSYYYYNNGGAQTFYLDANADFIGSIDNVSVKQVQGNPATMTNMSSDDIVAWTPNLETDFDVARSSTTTRINASGYIEQVAPNVPRLNYDSGDSCPYLLTQAASTNLITYPISFGNNSYWTKSGASIEGDASDILSTVYTSDFSAGADGWTTYGRSVVDGNIDGISGEDNVLRMTSDATASSTHYARKTNVMTAGKNYLVTFDYYIPSTNTNCDGLTLPNSGYLQCSVLDAWTSASANISSVVDSNIFWYMTDGGNLNWDGVNTDSVYIKNVIVSEIGGFEAPKEIPVANGEELVTDGYPFVNGSWSKQSAWTISNGEAVYGGISNHYIHQPFVVEQDKIYKVEFTTDASSRTLLANESNLQLFEGILDAYRSAGTHIFYAKALHTSTNIRFYGYGSGGAFNMSVLSVKEVTSWSGGGFERDAYKLVEDTATSRHRCTTDNILTSSGNAHTLSVYAKADTRDWIGLEMYGVGDRMAWFDIANGVVGTKQANITSSEIVAMANGWYRCSITQNAPSSQGMFGVFVADEDDSYSYAGENKSVYLSYLQVEESDYASSLMLPVTEGSTTSRVADAITNAGNQSLFSGVNSSGVLYAEIAANSDDLTDRFLSISDGTSVNRINIGYSNTSNLIFALGYVSNSNQFLMAYTLTDITDFHKVAVRYTENDFSFWIDGVEVATDTSGSTFSASTLSECALNVGGGGSNFYGKTKALGVFDYLSDDEMETLTT